MKKCRRPDEFVPDEKGRRPDEKVIFRRKKCHRPDEKVPLQRKAFSLLREAAFGAYEILVPITGDVRAKTFLFRLKHPLSVGIKSSARLR